MDNHKVFCGFIIFLQIADLSWESAYNFSLCNHDEIREDLLNVLDAHMTLKEELQLDFHTCEDAPEGPEQSEVRQGERSPPTARAGSERSGRAACCSASSTGRGAAATGGCGPARCGSCSATAADTARPRWVSGSRDGPCRAEPGFAEPGRSEPCRADGAVLQEWRRGTVAPQEAVPGGGLCDEGKVRELLAVWRSYMNLA
ncbi:uncharacterized protein LOC118156472 isoform X1 [Oxyura jamaicensis]|uniref:uncharacterized protein LOC118156472 isoform X1 n=1 Tax=Oxyura jamaicensis TaxID=8884 RepID=UPI0015A5528A|nr:uncharacterized protein LOC118156472 isoform X1 [Oxyura jamaicensis]